MNLPSHDATRAAASSEGTIFAGEKRTSLPTPFLVDLNQQQLDSIAKATPGGADNVLDIYPLTPLQEGLLFHHLIHRASDSYILSTLLEAETRAQIDALADALQKVIDRHDVLRTAIFWDQLPRPVQVVARAARLGLVELGLDPNRPVVEQLTQRMLPRGEPWTLQEAPLLRLSIVPDTAESKWYALLQVHHIVCDIHALRTIVSEALLCLQGKEQGLPVPFSYRNYVVESLNRQHVGAEDFFRRKLAGITEPTAPFELNDVHCAGTEITEGRYTIDAAQARQLRSDMYRVGVTMARLFHAAWGLVVAHTAAKDEVVFGTVVLTRTPRVASSQRVLGMPLNTLPLRLNIKDMTAKELLEHTHTELVELLQYEHTPLTLAQRCSGISSRAPLFTTLFNYRRTPNETQYEHSGTLPVRELARGEAWSNYPISITVDDTDHEFILTAQTHRSIQTTRVLGYLHIAIQSLAHALQYSPTSRALALPVISESERLEVITHFNATAAPYSHDTRVPELVERQASRTPDAIALVSGDQALTYAELNRRANIVARSLRTRGVRPNERVAVLTTRSPGLVIALLGILKAGGAYVPIDVTYPAARVAHILRDSGAIVLLTEQRLRDTLPVDVPPVVTIEGDSYAKPQQLDSNLDDLHLGSTASDLAYVIYTSGSTGTPKGVMVEHRSLVNLVQWHCPAFNVRASARCSCTASIGFDAATWEIWPPLAVGGTLVMSPAGCSDDVHRLIAWWAHEPLDISFLATPLAELTFSERTSHRQLSVLLVGGDRLRQRPAFPTHALINNYGPTEATVVATSGPILNDDPCLHIGRPITNARIFILNRYAQPVAIGVAGEICIGGVGVARGYWNRPELTAERFIPDPYSADPGARMYKTGDLGRWRADGTIDYLGRNDNQVKVRGFRIELAEIESRLLELNQVTEAVAVLREDVSHDKRIVAYVVTKNPGVLGITELRHHLKASLPDYMVPSAFVTVERIPLTPNGKVDRNALPAPTLDAYSSHQFEAPQGDLETALVAIWEEVLQIRGIGRNANFFELGGHSLLATRVISRTRERLQVDLPVRSLFEAPTIKSFAEGVAGGFPSLTSPQSAPSFQDIDKMTDQEVMAELADLQRRLGKAMDQAHTEGRRTPPFRSNGSRG